MAASNLLAEKRAKTLRMVQTALLAAIEVILTLLYIPVGTINLNFGLVPIVIAGIFISPLCGALIGGVSGIVTMIQVLGGQSPFYAFLITANPVAACVLCVVKTAAAGFVSGVAYYGLRKLGGISVKKKFIAALLKPFRYASVNSAVAAVLCPVVNTGIFALGMLTIFGSAMMSDPVISTWTTGGLVALVFVVLIGINFFVELALNVVVCPILSKALRSTRFFKEQDSVKIHTPEKETVDTTENQ